MEKIGAEFFDRLWQEAEPRDGMKHTRETWDRMASMMASDTPESEAAKLAHCRDVAEYLKSCGALKPGAAVIDIGCGTGSYDVEFAKTAGRVVCTDISPVMLEYCRAAAEARGLDNMEYKACDFMTADIDAEGWRKSFDLVFTSITPAITGLASVLKINDISKGWCLNNSFINRTDYLRRAVMRDVYGKDVKYSRVGITCYYLFNILWQLGIHPEVKHYREDVTREQEVTRELATHIAATIFKKEGAPEEEIVRIYDYLGGISTDGKVTHRRTSFFAWTIWQPGEQ